jgi:hypothetical protein
MEKNDFSISICYEDEVITFSDKMVKIHWELENIRARVVEEFNGEKT